MKSRREKFNIGGKLGLRCKHCLKIKVEKEFYWFAGQNAYRPNCKECEKDRNRQQNLKYKLNAKPKRVVLASLEQEDFYALTLKELGL